MNGNSEHSLWYPTTFRNASVSIGPVEERKLNGRPPFALFLFFSHLTMTHIPKEKGTYLPNGKINHVTDFPYLSYQSIG